MLQATLMIRLGRSKDYVRLMSLLTLLTMAFIYHATFYIWIQVGLYLLLLKQGYFFFQYQSPCAGVEELCVGFNRWSLLQSSGAVEHFESGYILLHNGLFQLLQLKKPQKKKLLVLFNDQLSIEQLRVLHVKSLLEQSP